MIRFFKFIENRILLIVLFLFSLCLLQIIQAKNVEAQDQQIVAGVLENWPPQYSTDRETKMPTGFAVDIMNAVGRISGIQIKYKVFQEWPTLNKALSEKEIDVIPNMGITKEREVSFNYTEPVETTQILFFVRKTSNDIKTINDITGRAVSVVDTNKGRFLMEERSWNNLKIYQSLDEALMSMISGTTDALVYPNPPLWNIIEQYGISDKVKIIGEPLLEIKRALATNKDDVQLIAKLDDAVKKLLQSKEYKKIYQQWYGKTATYWTGTKIAMLMSTLLLIVAGGLLIWRFVSVHKVNAKQKILLERYIQATDSLEKSEKKYSQLISQMSAGFALHEIIVDSNDTPVDYRFVEVNRMFEELTGLSGGQIVGKTVRDVLPQTENFWIETFGKVALTGEPVICENFSKELGKHFEVLAYCPHGKMFATIISDITERKKTRDTLDRLFHLAPDLIGVVNIKEGYFKQVNPAWEAILGRQPEEILSRPYNDFIHPDDHDKTRQGVKQLLSGKPLLKFVNHYRNKDGSYRTIEWHTTKAEADGTVYAVGRDITDRKKMEEERKKYHEDLEKTVDERTAELRKMLNLMSGREIRMAELKRKNLELEAQLKTVQNGGHEK